MMGYYGIAWEVGACDLAFHVATNLRRMGEAADFRYSGKPSKQLKAFSNAWATLLVRPDGTCRLKRRGIEAIETNLDDFKIYAEWLADGDDLSPEPPAYMTTGC